jgi:hypothetical protein
MTKFYDLNHQRFKKIGVAKTITKLLSILFYEILHKKC